MPVSFTSQFGTVSWEYVMNEEIDLTLYAEIQMLFSAGKVKAILVLFGKNFNQISVKDIRNYLNND